MWIVYKSMLISLLMLTLTYARDIIVTPSGTGTTCTQDQPCQVQQALTLATANDIILLQDGIYTTPIRTQRAGQTIKAVNRGKAQFLGANITTTKRILVTLQHSNCTLDGLMLDGQKNAYTLAIEAPSKPVEHLVIQNTTLQNSRGPGIRIVNHGSIYPVRDIRIRHNSIRDPGWQAVGECIYIGSAEDKGEGAPVEQVEIVGNILYGCTQNAVDFKRNAAYAHMYYNIIDHQRYRPITSKKSTEGTLAIAGVYHTIHDNYIRDVDGHNTIFKVRPYAGHYIYSNLIVGTIDTTRIVQPHQDSEAGLAASIVQYNTFAQLSGNVVERSSGLIVRDNDGVSAPLTQDILQQRLNLILGHPEMPSYSTQ